MTVLGHKLKSKIIKFALSLDSVLFHHNNVKNASSTFFRCPSESLDWLCQCARGMEVMSEVKPSHSPQGRGQQRKCTFCIHRAVLNWLCQRMLQGTEVECQLFLCCGKEASDCRKVFWLALRAHTGEVIHTAQRPWEITSISVARY